MFAVCASAISRVARSFQIPRLCKAILRLHKSLDCTHPKIAGNIYTLNGWVKVDSTYTLTAGWLAFQKFLGTIKLISSVHSALNNL